MREQKLAQVFFAAIELTLMCISSCTSIPPEGGKNELVLRISSPHKTYRATEAVPITIFLHNFSNAPLLLEGTAGTLGGPLMSYVSLEVRNPSGKKRKDILSQLPIIVNHFPRANVVAPGETYSLTFKWKFADPEEPGEYKIQATLERPPVNMPSSIGIQSNVVSIYLSSSE